MYHLAIDIGNSSLKVGVFEAQKLLRRQVFAHENELSEWLRNLPIDKGIISSVGSIDQISTAFPLLQFGAENVQIPILNKYKTPQTLGKDRLAGAIGAHSLFLQNDCLVIDLGTCVTYDLVTSIGEYIGGAISPGLMMRFKALHHYTARLPFIEEPQSDATLIGNDTNSCIQSGVVNGLRFEIEKAIEQYRLRYPEMKVLLCGGDAQFFESIIKEDIFAFPDLVLLGLNFTLLHNAH